MNIGPNAIQQPGQVTPAKVRTKRRIDNQPTPGEVDLNKKTRIVNGTEMAYEKSMVLIDNNGDITGTLFRTSEQVALSFKAGFTMTNVLSLDPGKSLPLGNSFELYLPNRSDSSSNSSKTENSSYSSVTESDTESILSEKSNPQIDLFFGEMEGYE